MSAEDIDNHIRLMRRTPASTARYVADGLIKMHDATINDLPRHLRGQLLGYAITLNTLAERLDIQDTP